MTPMAQTVLTPPKRNPDRAALSAPTTPQIAASLEATRPLPNQPAPNQTLAPRRDALLCAALLVLAILATQPISPFGFSDDFSYAKTALDLARTGHFLYNGWAAPVEGWLPVWGALLIRCFGFSFNLLRLAMLPIAMACALLFHRILARFGIGRRNALLGTLTLTLTPLFLPLAASFMTDVPGLFALLVCLYMCQRAACTTDSRASLVWLLAAAAVNLLLGSVRQTAWLGALIMVPSAGWLIRKRLSTVPIFPAALAISALSHLAVRAILHWAAAQPGFVPEPLLIPLSQALHPQLFGQTLRAALCLLLLVLPVLVGWLPTLRTLRIPARLRVAAIVTALTFVLIHLALRPLFHSWQMPWLYDVLAHQGMAEPDNLIHRAVTLPAAGRIAISILVLATALIAVEQLLGNPRPASPKRAAAQLSPSRFLDRSPTRMAAWLLGPYALIYLLLLLPRAATFLLFDRYLLALLPCAIVLLLQLYQRRVAPALPTLSFAVLALFATYGLAGTHDYYAESRAGAGALDQLYAARVPDTAISEGFNRDGWLQLTLQGHMADRAHLVPDWNVPPDCPSLLPGVYEPALRPVFLIVPSPTRCLQSTTFARVPYRAWLPPFHRAVITGRIR